MALILQKGIPVRDKVRKYLKYLGYQKGRQQAVEEI